MPDIEQIKLKRQNEFLLEVWIGLARVRPEVHAEDILNGASGAFVNVVALARSKTEYREKVKEALAGMRLALMRIEGAERLNTRLRQYTVDPEIIRHARALLKGGDRVRFALFHAFP